MQLAVRDAARFLNVSEKTIYRWINEKSIPAYRVGDQYRFNRAELLEWATSRKLQISPEIFKETEDSLSPLPSLLEAIQAGGIHYNTGGADPASVLWAVTEAMPLPAEMDRQFLHEVLLARELLGSTGIGDGIAIPHVRNPIVLHVSRPMITVCFLQHPIDFGSLDGKPVTVLFTLLSPSVRAHLHMLSRLAFVLRDPAFKAALTRKAPPDELFALIRQAEQALVSG